MSKVIVLAAVAATLLSSACSPSNSTDAQPLAPTPVTAAPTPPVASEHLSGPAVVARVAQRHPERLAAGVSHEQRLANMEFLRDRIIELGNCSGLLLAWNRKMNGQRSVDAIDWRHGENDANDVVDLASDYDNTSRTLELHWIIVEGPAGWDPFPTACQ